jgi:hypothetical protein
VSALLIGEAALRASALSLCALGLLALWRVRNPAHERLAWLSVVVFSLSMPLALFIAHQMPLPSPDPSASIVPAVTVGESTVRWMQWAYAGITVALLARVIVGLLVIGRGWRDATPEPALSSAHVAVRSSNRVSTPAVVGGGILLPADWHAWSIDQRQMVLAHEQSHLARGDFYWHLLARLYLAVFWFCPVAWWIVRRLALLAEHLSDDAALTQVARPADYAHVLLQFSRMRAPHQLVVSMTRRSEMTMRVERILRARRTTDGPARPSRALAVCLTAFAVGTLTTPRLDIRALDRSLPRALRPPLRTALAPLSGAVTTSSARLGPLRGSLGPLRGSLGPLRGSLGPLRGSLGPLRGSLGPLQGSLGPLQGSLAPLAPLRTTDRR